MFYFFITNLSEVKGERKISKIAINGLVRLNMEYSIVQYN